MSPFISSEEQKVVEYFKKNYTSTETGKNNGAIYYVISKKIDDISAEFCVGILANGNLFVYHNLTGFLKDGNDFKYMINSVDACLNRINYSVVAIGNEKEIPKYSYQISANYRGRFRINSFQVGKLLFIKEYPHYPKDELGMLEYVGEKVHSVLRKFYAQIGINL